MNQPRTLGVERSDALALKVNKSFETSFISFYCLLFLFNFFAWRIIKILWCFSNGKKPHAEDTFSRYIKLPQLFKIPNSFLKIIILFIFVYQISYIVYIFTSSPKCQNSSQHIFLDSCKTEKDRVKSGPSVELCYVVSIIPDPVQDLELSELYETCTTIPVPDSELLFHFQYSHDMFFIIFIAVITTLILILSLFLKLNENHPLLVYFTRIVVIFQIPFTLFQLLIISQFRSNNRNFLYPLIYKENIGQCSEIFQCSIEVGENSLWGILLDVYCIFFLSLTVILVTIYYFTQSREIVEFVEPATEYYKSSSPSTKPLMLRNGSVFIIHQNQQFLLYAERCFFGNRIGISKSNEAGIYLTTPLLNGIVTFEGVQLSKQVVHFSSFLFLLIIFGGLSYPSNIVRIVFASFFAIYICLMLFFPTMLFYSVDLVTQTVTIYTGSWILFPQLTGIVKKSNEYNLNLFSSFESIDHNWWFSIRNVSTADSVGENHSLFPRFISNENNHENFEALCHDFFLSLRPLEEEEEEEEDQQSPNYNHIDDSTEAQPPPVEFPTPVLVVSPLEGPLSAGLLPQSDNTAPDDPVNNPLDNPLDDGGESPIQINNVSATLLEVPVIFQHESSVESLHIETTIPGDENLENITPLDSSDTEDIEPLSVSPIVGGVVGGVVDVVTDVADVANVANVADVADVDGVDSSHVNASNTPEIPQTPQPPQTPEISDVLQNDLEIDIPLPPPPDQPFNAILESEQEILPISTIPPPPPPPDQPFNGDLESQQEVISTTPPPPPPPDQPLNADLESQQEILPISTTLPPPPPVIFHPLDSNDIPNTQILEEDES